MAILSDKILKTMEMKIKILKSALLLAVFCTAASCSNAQQKAEFDPKSLDEKLLSLNGETVAFSEILKKHAGKPMVIAVWASWCSDCVKAMPKFKELQDANPNVEYVYISMDRAEENWRTGVKKHNLVGDQYFSTDGMKGNFAKSIDLDWIPRYIIIDKTGKIAIYRAIETDFEHMNATLKKL